MLMSVIFYLLWIYYFPLQLCPGFWFVATAWVGFSTWLWHKIHTEVGSDLSMLILETRSLSFDCFINSGVIDINVRVSFLNPKYFLRCYDCLALLVLIKLLEVVLDFKIFVNSWNSVAMPGLLPLITTWICWIWLQNRYLAPLVPHLLLLVRLWLIVDIYPF